MDDLGIEGSSEQVVRIEMSWFIKKIQKIE
jgi:hypothetical protein